MEGSFGGLRGKGGVVESGVSPRDASSLCLKKNDHAIVRTLKKITTKKIFLDLLALKIPELLSSLYVHCKQLWRIFSNLITI